MFTFKKNYFFLFILIFIIEVLIALYVKDNFIRPYMGDVLVVILIYCFVRAFLKIPVVPAATGVLIFSFLIEALQYFNIVEVLELGHSSLARTVIGTSFAWEDILAYIAGFILILIGEKWRKRSLTARSRQ